MLGEKIKRCLVLVGVCLLCMTCSSQAMAAEGANEQENEQKWEDEIGTESSLSDLDEQVVWDLLSLENFLEKYTKLQAVGEENQIFPARAVFKGLISGNLKQVGKLCSNYLKAYIKGQSGDAKGFAIKFLLLGICAAMFRLLNGLFAESKLGMLGEYSVMLIALSLLLAQYKQMTGLAEDTLQKIGEFIPIFVPAFITSIGIACGMKTAVGYQTILMGITYLAVKVMIQVLLPLVYVYLMLSIMDVIWQDDRMGTLLDLMKKCMGFSLKLVTRVVAGIGMVQALILPVIDSLQGMALQKMISILPGLGNLSDQVFKMFVGSCVLIKNCLGIFIMILLLALCVGPLLKLFLFVFVLRGTASLMGILGEKQIVKCMGRMGEACMLLGKIVTAAILMLFLLLSIACYLKGCV